MARTSAGWGLSGLGPSFSPDGTQIVYQSANDKIVTANADGTGTPKVVFLNPEYYFVGDPAWSPDGAKIAFYASNRTAPANSAVYTVNPDGSGLERVTSSPLGEAEPDWSPDGLTLAYGASGNAGDNDPDTFSCTIGLVRRDGTSSRTIAPNATDPAFSPNGKKVAVYWNSDIYVLNRDGTGRTNVTKTPGSGKRVPTDAAPAWQPVRMAPN